MNKENTRQHTEQSALDEAGPYQDHWTCSNCGKPIPDFIAKNNPPLPCPNCGHKYPYSVTYFDNKFNGDEE